MYFRYTQHISLLTKNDKQTLKTGVACSIQPKNQGSELLTTYLPLAVRKEAGQARRMRSIFMGPFAQRCVTFEMMGGEVSKILRFFLFFFTARTSCPRKPRKTRLQVLKRPGKLSNKIITFRFCENPQLTVLLVNKSAISKALHTVA